MIQDFIQNEEKFTQEINSMSRLYNIGIMDSITLFCDDHKMDIYDVVPLIGTTMKERIKMEAIDKKMFKIEQKLSTLF